ncbi:MAG: SPFH domain-containing protein [Clostridiales bacterium]|nr:SPFH domain-containing protein [Clostridiales bacterium]
MALFDVVRFNGLRSKEWLIYKYPTEDIVLGSQLIVQEGQLAIFIRHGAICDVFYPGTYTMRTENLPVLNSIVKLPFGGKAPISAEIYFVNTTTMLEINWGTSDPIQLIDPKYYVKLRVRAFGQIGVKVLDAPMLFRELIGGMPQSDIVKISKIREYFRGLLVMKVKTAIADAIITNGISALEISAHMERISAKVKEQIVEEFSRYGFYIANFYIQSINFPDEDFAKINKILEDKAAFEIMGEQRYAAKRSFDIYEGAATNKNGVAGAFAAGGVGLGAAMGMGSAMSQQVGNPAAANPGKGKECPNCHKSVSASMKFCPECGTDLREKRCECGQVLTPGTKFCPECGKKVI